MTDTAWGLTFAPTMQALAVLFQVAVAATLLRATTNRAEARWLALLFLANAVVALLQAPRYIPGATSAAIDGYVYAVDTVTGPLLLAFLAVRLGGRFGGRLAAVVAAAGVAHGLFIAYGFAASPQLYGDLLALDRPLREAPLLAGTVVLVVVLSGGDRFDKWVALAWGIRAASWAPFGVQGAWRELGLGHRLSWDVMWLLVLGAAVAVATVRLRTSRDPSAPTGYLVLAAGLVAGFGGQLAGAWQPHDVVDHVLLVYGRGLLVLMAFDQAWPRRVAAIVAPSVAVAIALFHALRINLAERGETATGGEMAAMGLWGIVAGGVVLAVMDHRFAGIGHTPTSYRAPKGYRLRACLRDQDQGATYRATAPDSSDVVLKFLPWSSPDATRECKALRAVGHPNVVPLRGVHELGGRTIIETPFVPGGDLAARLRHGERPDAARLARGVLAGLSALHSAGFTHGDIKPSNIILAESGDARLIDLGVARGPGGDGTVTIAAPVIVGTPQYMAPEVAVGGIATAAADVWSAAATIHEVFAGRPYHGGGPGDDLGALVRRAAAMQPYRPSPAVPAAWHDWFERALHPDIGHRFPDAAVALAAVPA